MGLKRNPRAPCPRRGARTLAPEVCEADPAISRSGTAGYTLSGTASGMAAAQLPKSLRLRYRALLNVVHVRTGMEDLSRPGWGIFEVINIMHPWGTFPLQIFTCSLALLWANMCVRALFSAH